MDDDAAQVPNLLPHLLLSVGVGTRWSYRDLVARSGLSIATWSRAMEQVPAGRRRRNFEPAVIDGMYNAAVLLLRGNVLPDGSLITRKRLEQAARADSGYLAPTTLKTADNAADLANSVVGDGELTEPEQIELASALVDRLPDEARRRYLIDQIARLPLDDLICLSHAITNLLAAGGGGGRQLDTGTDGRDPGPPPEQGGRLHGALG